MNEAEILHNIHRIRHSAWSLINMGHNLRGQKDGTWQAEVMTWVLLALGYYVDDSQENSYKQQYKHMEIVHHLVCWERQTMWP